MSSSNPSYKGRDPSRPPSSLSRPASRNAARPLSSAGHRPASSLSVRPPSSASAPRPQSRFSNRASKNTRSKLIPFCQALVAQIIGRSIEDAKSVEEGESFRERVEQMAKSLEGSPINKAAVVVDISVIDRQISGFAQKARVYSQDALSQALEACYRKLKTNVEAQESDLDQTTGISIALSNPPNESTLTHASIILDEIANPPPPPKSLRWADILADDPFEGEHWEGVYGLPPGFVKSSTTQQQGDEHEEEWDSSSSLSHWDTDENAPSVPSSDDDFRHSPPSSPVRPTEPPPVPNDEFERNDLPPPYEQRQMVEDLTARQYWKDEWRTDADLSAVFDLGDPSTLGPTLNLLLSQPGGSTHGPSLTTVERYINEEDMVREILMALQGNDNTVLYWIQNLFQTTPATPRVVHLSLASQESILSSLAQTATTVASLRRFSASILSQSIPRQQHSGEKWQPRKLSTTRTCEAFADALDYLVRGFNAWCAAREDAISHATAGVDGVTLIVSLLDTEMAIRNAYEDTFNVLLQIVEQLFHCPSDSRPSTDPPLFEPRQRVSPAALTASLLDILFSEVQSHMERQDKVTSDALMRIFVHTAEPVWGMVGRWLKDGMGSNLGLGSGMPSSPFFSELDDEFFIESSGVGVGSMSLGLLDPEFWQEGYDLRSDGFDVGDAQGGTSMLESNAKVIPRFLEHVASIVLGAGKAVGLIRALGMVSAARLVWKTFAELVGSGAGAGGDQKSDAATLFSVSVDTLSRLIYDELLPYCQSTGSQLVDVLVVDCELWRHLRSIEDLLLMRKGDTVSHFIDVLFSKMDSGSTWGDLHFLNTAFNDVVESNLHGGSQEWINPSLVRLSYRGGRNRDRTISQTVKAINGLSIEYTVPFPLTYLFQPKVIQHYNELFVFFLQIRRAKSVLERILVRGDRGRNQKLREELKVFYAMRSRLSWFINTLLNFLTTYVIDAEVKKFHEQFKGATLFDDMIELHEEHLDKMRARCFLKPSTAALHNAILSVLDMPLHFSEAFAQLAGDTTTTLDVSRQSAIMKRHRSRRAKQQKRNVIGFSQFLQPDADDSSDEDEDDRAVDSAKEPLDPSTLLSTSAISFEGDFFSRVEIMASELNGLIRIIRRNVEGLAGGSGEAAATFGVLAFTLEDWDI